MVERHPFAAATVLRVYDAGMTASDPGDAGAIEAFASAVRRALARDDLDGVPDTTPRVPASERFVRAIDDVVDDGRAFFAREAIATAITAEEKTWILRGMMLTRAIDNRLKALFLGGEVKFEGAGFQGKGFRSLGQEAVFAAGLRLRRGPEHAGEDGTWRGDVVAPLIRDLGAALAMRSDDEAIRQVLSAQMGKAGPPMDGRDFHIGDWEHGVLPACAPLSISSLTVAGVALAFRLGGEPRVAVSFIGEGGSSLGEWHEAINACAARALPAVFCIENNQTALSTPTHEQSAVRVFADKASGYGIPAVTVDGTDPEAIAAAFGAAADRARDGGGPTLIELVAMRMCGHAHHDDMLYLGKEPKPSWDYPEPSDPGYADREAYAWWTRRDPIRTYATRLAAEGVLSDEEVATMRREVEDTVERAARTVIDAPWPSPDDAGTRVVAGEPPRVHVEVLEGRTATRPRRRPALPPVDAGAPHDPRGSTFLDAVMRGVGDALRSDPSTFVYGEDVGGTYGNAFLLLRPLLEEFGDRILNSTLAEGAVVGVCTGAALAGRRPIGEIQFNDFIATGFNQLVNNAAKVRYRWGGEVPMVLRMPWGGLRGAGPYHSQNTEPWFYRTPGLKIVAPSTPRDARAMMAAAVADPDPVLYYEHIGLYRDPKIKQRLPEEAPEPIPLGTAALRRAGSDLAIVSYGAYVHVALRVAARLADEGVECAVLDLRSLAPLDRDALLAVAASCGKVLVAHEDSRTGGIGESLAAILQEEIFEDLDAPVRVVGALDAPVPYAPPLERAFLPSEDRVLHAARLLAAY